MIRVGRNGCSNSEHKGWLIVRRSPLLLAVVIAGLVTSTSLAAPLPRTVCPPGFETVVPESGFGVNADLNGDELWCRKVPAEGANASVFTDNTYNPELVTCPHDMAPADTTLTGSPFPGYAELLSSRDHDADEIVCVKFNKNEGNFRGQPGAGAAGGATIVVVDDL